MRSIRLRVFAIALFAVGIHVSAANAAVITFNSLASWQSAVVVVNTTTFEENASGNFTFHGSSATFGGATFTVDAGSIFTIDPALFNGCPGYCEIGTGDVLSAQGGANLLTISGGGVTALAFDWMTWDTAALSVTLSTGDVIPLAATEFVPGFLGITSTIPITSLTINVPQGLGVLNLDNFAVGRIPTTTTTTSGTVPEPGSLLLILSGLMVLGVSRHRQQAPSTS